MRILHFYKTYYPDTVGGTEQFINQLARATLDLGVQTDVLTLSPNCEHTPLIQLHGHRVHRVPRTLQLASTGFSLNAFSRFAQLAKAADLIHYHFPWPFMDLVHFTSQIKKPTVVTYHSDIIKQKTLLKFYRPLKHRFLSSVDKIVATSPNYIETSPALTRFKDKTVVIPIGLDKSTYSEPSTELLAKWRERIGPRFFLFIGMLRYYKGLHILLEALKDTSFPMVIVGTGLIEQELKEQATRLNLKNVHFLGSLPEKDKIALLTLCSGLVFPSHLRSEAFGISLLEGAMFGKPLISCEIGTGTSFINVHNKTGLVIEPENPRALREAMRFLWDNPVEAEKMGNDAEKRYWDYFTAEKMASSYVGLYKDLLTIAPLSMKIRSKG
jgi:glycosyltransferase involved in cell wall biosynthesis